MTRFLLLLLLLPAAAPALAQAPPALATRLVAEGFERPLFVTHAGDRSGRLFVVEQPGTIRVIEDGAVDPEPFLDIRDLVSFGGERGLLGLAFHPDFAENRYFYVNYTRKRDGASVVARFEARRNPARRLESRKTLLRFSQPFGNHNGGMLAFGPDGLLYIGAGDGGGGGDPGDRAQDPDELLGKILRIDVDGGRRYAIPDDNPFADGGGAPEIFALGFRNPWRFSFDRAAGALRVADVGQGRREEAMVVKAGRNYGWRLREGSLCFRPSEGCADGVKLVGPQVEYRHAQGRCSITGGYVYRGRDIPALRGTYLYADFCSGEAFGRRRGEDEVLLRTGMRIASFGEDRKGELYIVDIAGRVLQLVPG